MSHTVLLGPTPPIKYAIRGGRVSSSYAMEDHGCPCLLVRPQHATSVLIALPVPPSKPTPSKKEIRDDRRRRSAFVSPRSSAGSDRSLPTRTCFMSRAIFRPPFDLLGLARDFGGGRPPTNSLGLLKRFEYSFGDSLPRKVLLGRFNCSVLVIVPFLI